MLVAACGVFSSDDSVDPVATPAATAVGTAIPGATLPGATPGAAQPTPGARLEPDGERIFADVRFLADEIGPRPGGTDVELRAAEWIADRLRGLGYEVSLQEFSIGTQTGRSSLLGVLSPTPRTVATLPLGHSATARAEGRLVSAGIGRPDEFTDAPGAIVLIERGTLLFAEKVANAQAAGAAGIVIYNNETGIFLGDLGSDSRIPAVSISQSEGRSLLQQLNQGEVRVEISVGALSGEISHNVIARPPGRDCETISGGHYDSVPQAPGASDNASGTATVLEMAAILAQAGETDNHCFVLFGAEELGLLGSKHYVAELSQAERERIKAMLNFDMVGVGDEAWLIIGTPELQARTASLAAELGIEVETGDLRGGLASDHASFLAAGIPSVMFHRWEDPLLHTPQDVSERVQPQYLEQAASMGLALLESLSAGG